MSVEFNALYEKACQEYTQFLNTAPRHVGYGMKAGKFRDATDEKKCKELREYVCYLEYVAKRHTPAMRTLFHPVKKYEKRIAKETNPAILAVIKKV